MIGVSGQRYILHGNTVWINWFTLSAMLFYWKIHLLRTTCCLTTLSWSAFNSACIHICVQLVHESYANDSLLDIRVYKSRKIITWWQSSYLRASVNLSVVELNPTFSCSNTRKIYIQKRVRMIIKRQCWDLTQILVRFDGINEIKSNFGFYGWVTDILWRTWSNLTGGQVTVTSAKSNKSCTYRFMIIDEEYRYNRWLQIFSDCGAMLTSSSEFGTSRVAIVGLVYSMSVWIFISSIINSNVR